MNSFKILPNLSWYTNPTNAARQRGKFLSKEVEAFFHGDYVGGNSERRETIGSVENIITTLKNQFLDKSNEVLVRAGKNLVEVLKEDLPQVLQKSGKETLTVCIIPRSKALSSYTANQLVFRQAVIVATKSLKSFIDGSDYMIRHTNTRTTHLDRSGYGGDGDLPYPGITKKTCTISDKVKGADILLIDDLYTETVNIDEDAIQALFDHGANSVFFYSLGKTTART